MKLVIQRSQQDVKGMLGAHKGVSFMLRYQLQLTDEETSLVQKYSLGNYVLTTVEAQGSTIPGNTIQTLVNGQTSVVPDVMKLLEEQNTITEACDRLPILFDVCRSFGGNEVITYPRKKSED